MEKGFESWFQNQELDYQSPNPNSSSAQFPSFGNMNMVSPKASARQQPYGWFYGLPRYRQGLIPVVNPIVKEEISIKGNVANPDEAGNGVQKKFLVFDQSGDQTTLIYSSGVGTAPIRYQLPSSNFPKPQFRSHPVLVDEYIKENDGVDSKSEMREDTEELNALLYSDDDDVYDDEMSTGHSPGSKKERVEQKGENGSGQEEEVASTVGPAKRRRGEDGGNIVNSLEDTASSGKSGVNCSGNDGNGVFEEEFDSFSFGNKRMRKEKMKETINLIRNLVPGDKNGKNAIMVIDEAISYLRSLKVKAEALGFDSL